MDVVLPDSDASSASYLKEVSEDVPVPLTTTFFALAL
ncbi:unnamed protein product, partial [marine sediment metagenome]